MTQSQYETMSKEELIKEYTDVKLSFVNDIDTELNNLSIITNVLTSCFLIKYKTIYIIMKVEQIEKMRIVYTQWDRCTSYDV